LHEARAGGGRSGSKICKMGNVWFRNSCSAIRVAKGRCWTNASAGTRIGAIPIAGLHFAGTCV